jgi:hypothetical protein
MKPPHNRLNPKMPNGRSLHMNTLLLTSQLVCYGVGIVSASLNIALFVRRHRRWRQIRFLQAGTRVGALSRA